MEQSSPVLVDNDTSFDVTVAVRRGGVPDVLAMISKIQGGGCGVLWQCHIPDQTISQLRLLLTILILGIVPCSKSAFLHLWIVKNVELTSGGVAKFAMRTMSSFARANGTKCLLIVPGAVLPATSQPTSKDGADPTHALQITGSPPLPPRPKL
jgi:hypothetical protein